MGTVEQYQIRKIFAISNALGISDSRADEDELHVLVSGLTGKESIKELTYREASNVIERLEELQGNAASPKPRKNSKEHKSRPGGVTSGQQKKIWALMYQLKKYDEVVNEVTLGDRLCRIIKKELNMDVMPKDPFVWMDFGQGNKLIEILKKYIESTGRKKRGVK